MKRNLFALLAVVLLWSVPASAQIVIPYPAFLNGTTADADQVNANNTALTSAALNRTGGTITGNITVNGGVTIDGIDIGAVLGGTGTPTFSTVTAIAFTAVNMTLSDTNAGALDVAGGINAGSGNVGIVGTDGRIPAITSTYFANLGMSGTNITSGLVPVANGGTGANFSATAQGALVAFSGTGVMTTIAAGGNGLFLKGTGAGSTPIWTTQGTTLTALNATELTSGTVPGARLSGTYANALTLSSNSNVITGAFRSSDGSVGVTSTTCNFTTSITVKDGLIVAGSGC